ncbi:MAG: hypothetical protein PHF56_16520 [Desulfuromonadaceae bacterium]|nr:hypothetical protein [Desulfuromonadaceae bacterium]
MRPLVEKVLERALLGLEEKFASMPPGPQMGEVWQMKMLIGLLRRDWDDAASLRAEEIDRLSALLKRGAQLAPDELRGPLMVAVARAEAGRRNLRISALEATLDELRQAVIKLHVWLEEEGEADAQVLRRDLWAFLTEANRRRVIDVRPW